MTAKFDDQMTQVNHRDAATEYFVRFKRDGKKIVGIQVFREQDGQVKAGKAFDLHDSAEYDSFNLSYYGLIETITEKTVTIVKSRGNNVAKHRLKLYEFAWRNYRFDLDETVKQNAIESQNI